MNAIQKILDAVYAAVGLAVKALLLFMVVLITGQVILRGSTGRSIKWAEEVALIAMVWVTFLTMAMGVRYDIHIRIDMFVDWLPKKGKIALEWALNLILALIAFLMVWYGYELTRYAMRSTMPATQFPTGVVYGVVPVAGAICLLQTLSRLLGGPRSVVAQNFVDGVQYREDKIKDGEDAK